MDNNEPHIRIVKLNDSSSLAALKSEWHKTLVAPQDGMWEALTNTADHWTFSADGKTVGYSSVDENNCLLQFFILPQWQHYSTSIFDLFIKQLNIKIALIGTNNPICLSVAMHLQKLVEVDTYLFHDFLTVNVPSKSGNLRLANETDYGNLVEFCHCSMGGPIEWLNGYISNLIMREEVFIFELHNEILGTCEVRKSDSHPDFADVGMIVSSNHRKKGLGSFLLGKAKEIAYQRNCKPICSCESNNIGSLKSIQNNGFRIAHLMLRMKF